MKWLENFRIMGVRRRRKLLNEKRRRLKVVERKEKGN